MKIIKEGIIPQHWWTGYNITCDYCKAVVQLEDEDQVVPSTYVPGKYLEWICFTCPCCRKAQKENNPNPKPTEE